jgi:hypothetical protein
MESEIIKVFLSRLLRKDQQHEPKTNPGISLSHGVAYKIYRIQRLIEEKYRLQFILPMIGNIRCTID